LLGLGLLLGLLEGLFEGLGLLDGLLDELLLALGLVLGLALALFEMIIASSLADTAETELRPHGDTLGLAVEANAGAIADPDARNDPASTQIATRQALLVATATGALRSAAQPPPARAVGAVPCPQP